MPLRRHVDCSWCDRKQPGGLAQGISSARHHLHGGDHLVCTTQAVQCSDEDVHQGPRLKVLRSTLLVAACVTHVKQPAGLAHGHIADVHGMRDQVDQLLGHTSNAVQRCSLEPSHQAAS